MSGGIHGSRPRDCGTPVHCLVIHSRRAAMPHPGNAINNLGLGSAACRTRPMAPVSVSAPTRCTPPLGRHDSTGRSVLVHDAVRWLRFPRALMEPGIHLSGDRSRAVRIADGPIDNRNWPLQTGSLEHQLVACTGRTVLSHAEDCSPRSASRSTVRGPRQRSGGPINDRHGAWRSRITGYPPLAGPRLTNLRTLT